MLDSTWPWSAQPNQNWGKMWCCQRECKSVQDEVCAVRMFHQSNVMSSMLEGSKTGVQGKFEVISCIYFFYFTIWYLYLSSISRFGWYSILSWWVLIWYLLLVLICNMIEILILTFLNSIQSNLSWDVIKGCGNKSVYLKIRTILWR